MLSSSPLHSLSLIKDGVFSLGDRGGELPRRATRDRSSVAADEECADEGARSNSGRVRVSDGGTVDGRK
jgi:hypothetical protein